MEVTDVNGVPTHVFSLKTEAKSGTLLLIVPGSPGMAHFYVPFASRLFDKGSGAYDVTVLSHAGHSPGFARCGGQETQGWFTLEDQITHKMAYISKQAKEKESLVLVGHSIGCYMILQMLKKLSPTRVKKAIFLFPTIERMLQSPNGRQLSPLFRPPFRSPLSAAVGLLSWIPHTIKQYFLNWYFYTTPSEHVDHVVQATININGKSMYNILSMAHQEMHEVSDPPLDVIDEHVHKMVFYYGDGDKWNTDHCYTDMADRFPSHDVNLCSHRHPHAFVLTASHDMADFVHSRLPNELVQNQT